MGSPGGAPPEDKDWPLEWRWGAAHPWMRPKEALAPPPTSDAPFVAGPSSPPRSSYCSPSSLTSSSCSSASSTSPCSYNTSSPGWSLDSSRLPFRLSLFPPSAASCTCSSSSAYAVQDASTREKGCSIPTSAAASPATSISTSLWPLSFTCCSLFRGAQIRPTHAPAQGESRANANPQATTADTSAPSTWLAGAEPVTAPAATPPASSAAARAVRGTEPLPENGAKTAAAGPVLSTTEAGAEEVRWVPQDGPGGTRAPVVPVAGALPAFRPLSGEAASTATDKSDRLPERKAAADGKAERGSEMVETEVEAVAGAAAAIDLSGTIASAAASATSEAAARVDEKGDQQKFEKAAHKSPERVQQLLLQFGDQTLNFLQRQQMALWSFFAFRDWRVKTLVHALSAMGEPVNLVVVNCRPPPPAAGSPSAALSSRDASQCSPDSSSPSLSHVRPASASPIPSSVAPSLSGSSAIVEPSVSMAADAGRPLGRREAKLTETAETVAPVAETQLAFLPSTSPTVGEDVVRGGYSPLYHTIWLCGNRLWSPFELRRVLLHELVHAFDFARANLSPNNCKHVACAEIRAYNLSGQCGWWRTRSYDIAQFNTVRPLPLRKETGAGSPRLGHQQQKGTPANDSSQWQQTKRNRCVTHGALNSLRQHRQCQAPGVAEDAVRDVFARCIRDTWPFLVPPERDSRWRPSRMWRPEAAEFLKK